jgi:hypothetical protein
MLCAKNAAICVAFCSKHRFDAPTCIRIHTHHHGGQHSTMLLTYCMAPNMPCSPPPTATPEERSRKWPHSLKPIHSAVRAPAAPNNMLLHTPFSCHPRPGVYRTTLPVPPTVNACHTHKQTAPGLQTTLPSAESSASPTVGGHTQNWLACKPDSKHAAAAKLAHTGPPFA